MTASLGGVIADVVCNDVPRLILPTTPLYSVCAFAGCWVYLLLRSANMAETVTLAVGVVTVAVLRGRTIKLAVVRCGLQADGHLVVAGRYW